MKPEKMAIKMLHMSHQLHVQEHPDYMDGSLPLDMAVVSQLFDAISLTYWEWWKRTDKQIDIALVQSKIVDVWHFLMAFLLSINNLQCSVEDEKDLRELVDGVTCVIGYNIPGFMKFNSGKEVKGYFSVEDILSDSRKLISFVVSDSLSHSTGSQAVRQFFMLCLAAGISDIQSLYKLYAKKYAIPHV